VLAFLPVGRGWLNPLRSRWVFAGVAIGDGSLSVVRVRHPVPAVDRLPEAHPDEAGRRLVAELAG
jgi:hypothetical protein